MSRYSLPTKLLFKEGLLDLKMLARAQRLQNKEGTDSYKRYEKMWNAMEGVGSKEAQQIRSKRRWDGTSDALVETKESDVQSIQSGVTTGSVTGQTNHIDQFHCETNDEVWIGIKFGEEESHYTLRDLHGESIQRADFDMIKSDASKYSHFMLNCWSVFLGETIGTTDELFCEVANLLNVPVSKIKGARVDSNYDEEKGDVVISFKARISRSGV